MKRMILALGLSMAVVAGAVIVRQSRRRAIA